MSRSIDARKARRFRRERTLPGAQPGFSYIEVLLATALLAAALTPALDALRDSLTGGLVQQQLASEQIRLAGKMEELLARPFDELDTEAQAVANPNVATSYSDAPGDPDRRLVYLSRYDGDNADGDADAFTGGDDGLLWIKVIGEDGGPALETLTAR